MEIETIIFDLDDTLYPSSSGIWSLIRERIDLFMLKKLNYREEEIASEREKFFLQYGTTLRGLESVHHIDPVEYLKFVHKIPLENYLQPNDDLINILQRIPQRKVIFTNGDRWHAKRVTDLLGVTDFFDDVIDILDVAPYCKPMEEAFLILLQKLDINENQKALIIDDNLRNIRAAKKLGLQAIWISENGNNTENNLIKIKKIENLDTVLAEFSKIG